MNGMSLVATDGQVMSGISERSSELTTLPVSTAILDPSGTIVAVNDTWKLFARRNGLRLPNFGIGVNYLNYCLSDDSRPSLRPEELKELLAGQRSLVTLIYPCHSPREKRWFSLIAFPLSLDHPGGIAILHIDLTPTVPLANMKTNVQISYPAEKTDNRVSVDTISGRIEHSILETLSAQLTTMFLRNRRAAARNQTPTQLAAERLARTVLTKRQREVLRLVGEGKTNKEIAQALFRSPHTIKLHVAAILERLHLRTRTEAALIASKMYAERSFLNYANVDSAGRSDRSLREKTFAD
jgi:DNA-binding CsgD family transcriptional regulator